MAGGEDEERKSATALTEVLGASRWEAVALARAYLKAVEGGAQAEEAAAGVIYDARVRSMKQSVVIASTLAAEGFIARLSPRKNTGSAANPITKLFPAAITEERFLGLLEATCVESHGRLTISDERQKSHSFVDFVLHKEGDSLPINVKNAGTRFESAKALVDLEPDDCIPIPAYKAYGAVEVFPNIIYAVSADYDLLRRLRETIPAVFNDHERIAWDLLNRYTGMHLRTAEDAFVYGMVRKYDQIKAVGGDRPFVTISARKAIRILQTMPKRTPGIGMRAWGTGAMGETNVHVSVARDMTPWVDIAQMLVQQGPQAVTKLIGQTKMEFVSDPKV